MSGIGIDVQVNARKLTDAKRQILDTSRALDDLNKRSTLDIDAKTNLPTIVQEMMDTMRKLEGVDAKAGKSGGLKIGESSYAAQLLDRFKKDAAIYDQAMGKMGKQLDELYEKKKRLESVPFTAPGWEKAQKELEGVNKDYNSRVSEYEKTQAKYDPRFNLARSRVENVEGNLDNHRTIPEGGGWGKMGLGKMFGYGAALMGGFSIMSFLHDSMNKAGGYYGSEADFQMRTGKGLSPFALSQGARYGYGPADTLGIYDAENRHTGLKGSGLSTLGDQALKGARAWGISPESVLGYHSGMFPASTMSPEELKKQTERLQRIAEGIGQGGRIEEILKRNQDITVSAAQTLGRALTSGEASGLADLQMRLWSTGPSGSGALGTSAINNLQNASQGGGSQRGRMFMYNAFGGNQIKDVGGYMDVMEKMQGPMTTDKARSIFDAMRQIPGAYDGKGKMTDYGALFLTSLGLPAGQARYLISAANGGAFGSDQLPMGASTDSKLDGWGKTSGAHHLKTMAGMEGLKVDLGGKILPWVDDLKGKIPGLYNNMKKGNWLSSIPDFLKDNPLGDMMVAGAGLKVASGVGIPGAAAAGVAAGATGRRGLSLLNPVTAGVAAGAYVLAPHNDEVGEDAIVRKINKGASPKEIEAEARRQAEANHSTGGGIFEELLMVMRELNLFLHDLNHDPIRRPPGAQGSTH